ncbi:MAG TPA: sensor histidine kinase [Ktedonobacterales bacterium]
MLGSLRDKSHPLFARGKHFTQRLLSLSVFYKVLIANSTIVVLGALAGTAITLRVATRWPGARVTVPLVVSFSIVGLLLSAGINVLVLRAALSPLTRLQLVVQRVRAGDLSARAHTSPLADADIAQLAETLNQILDDVQRYESQVHALSGDLIRAQEDERQRISRELHDDTGQVLTLLLIRLKLLEGVPGAEALGPQIAELRALVAGAIEQIRRLALNLRPPTLDQLGLASALRSLTLTFSDSTHLPVRLSLPEDAIQLPPTSAIAVYRVVQEALTNIARHAGASAIQVDVAIAGNVLIVDVHDDGQGFVPDAILRHRTSTGQGVGLFGMEERARLVGGQLTISSAPGKGTTVQITLPLEGTPVPPPPAPAAPTPAER